MTPTKCEFKCDVAVTILPRGAKKQITKQEGQDDPITMLSGLLRVDHTNANDRTRAIIVSMFRTQAASGFPVWSSQRNFLIASVGKH